MVTTTGRGPAHARHFSTPPHEKSGLDACAVAKAARLTTPTLSAHTSTPAPAPHSLVWRGHASRRCTNHIRAVATQPPRARVRPDWRRSVQERMQQPRNPGADGQPTSSPTTGSVQDRKVPVMHTVDRTFAPPPCRMVGRQTALLGCLPCLRGGPTSTCM